MLIQEDLHLPITDANDKEKKVNFVVHYFHSHRNRHTFYALKFFACEILNLINVFSQIYFMDFFLGGKNFQNADLGIPRLLRPTYFLLNQKYL